MSDAHLVHLATADLAVVVDASRGGEVRSLRDLRTGREVLMRTPWASSATMRRPGRLTFPAEASADAWMESYAGGWQVLFPHAGGSTDIEGDARQYHGESSIVPWRVDVIDAHSVQLVVDLLTVPVRMQRTISLTGQVVSLADRLENLSGLPVTYDYVQHPVFGAEFLRCGGKIRTGARTYVADPRFEVGEMPAGVSQAWPVGRTVDGNPVDLDRVPMHGDRALRFGWLDDFGDEPWASIDSAAHDLSVRLTWRGPGLSRAWFWQEVAATNTYPWFGRGYAIAIEPSTTVTGGDARERRVLEPGATVEYETRLRVDRSALPAAPCTCENTPASTSGPRREGTP